MEGVGSAGGGGVVQQGLGDLKIPELDSEVGYSCLVTAEQHTKGAAPD